MSIFGYTGSGGKKLYPLWPEYRRHSAKGLRAAQPSRMGDLLPGSFQASMQWKDKEILARRAIEDQGFTVHDANIVFRENCPNIDLVVFSKTGASYIQVKSSNRPAGKDSVLIDGSPWTKEQLFNGAPVFNKHADHFQASFIVIVDALRSGETDFFIASPNAIEKVAVGVGRAFKARPLRKGGERKMFRKEVPRALLFQWRNAWWLLREGSCQLAAL